MNALRRALSTSELEARLEKLRVAILQHMIDEPLNFQDREELWMERENIRDLLATREEWAA